MTEHSSLVTELTRLLAVALSEDSGQSHTEAMDLVTGETGKHLRQFIEAVAVRIDPKHTELPLSQALQLLTGIRARHAIGIPLDTLPGLDIGAVARAHHADREFLLTYTAALEKANRDARAEFGRNRDTFLNQLSRIQSLGERIEFYSQALTAYEALLGIEQDSELPTVRGDTIGAKISDLKNKVAELQGIIDRAQVLANWRGPSPPDCDMRSRLEADLHNLVLLFLSGEGILKTIYAMLGLTSEPNGPSVVEAIQRVQRAGIEAGIIRSPGPQVLSGCAVRAERQRELTDAEFIAQMGELPKLS